MEKINFKFSRIICFEEEDFFFIQNEFKNSQIDIIKTDDINIKNIDLTIPNLFIGWKYIKQFFPKQQISRKKIANNLYWTFSNSEDKIIFDKDLKKFIEKSIKEFIPSNINTYDSILNGNINSNLDKIFSSKINFCFFGENESLYVYNDKYFTAINLLSISFTFEDLKEILKSIIKKYQIVFLNYFNIKDYIKEENSTFITLENIAWICKNEIITETDLHKFSPFLINEKYYVFFMSKLFDNINCKLIENIEILNRYSCKDFITEWLSKQSIYFKDGNEIVLNYSNKKTITGRINCNDKKFNPQLLPKNSPVRNEIVSRFPNGKIVVFDYVAFETKISILLTKNEEFIKKYINSDFHKETSKIIFSKNEILEKERKIGKQVNHSIIYGIGEEKLKKMLKENNVDIEKISEIKHFLHPILLNSKKINDECLKNGFIINPYKSIIHPQKEWASYNNYIQSTAADLVIDKLFKIRKLLLSKKSKFMYQVYDSFVFDINPEESNLIDEIKKILEKNGKHIFEVEYKIGNSLMECTVLQYEEEFGSIN